MSCLVLVLVPSAARAGADADAAPARRFGIGAMMGLNIATFVGEGAADVCASPENRLAFAMGGEVYANLLPWLAVRAGLMYSAKGARATDDGTDLGTVKVGYIEVPLLAAARVPVGGVEAYVLAGPRLSKLVSAKQVSPEGDEQDAKDNFTASDIGLVLGGGVAWALSAQERVTFELRYDRGLVTLDPREQPTDYKHRVISFLLGYQY